MGRLEAEAEMGADRRGLEGRRTGLPQGLSSALLLQGQADLDQITGVLV